MKNEKVNAQYNVAKPDSLPVRIAAQARRQMFSVYCGHFPPELQETVLDVGVTSDQSYEASNYFEAWYPHKNQITAVGTDDALFLEKIYPGLKFVRANALSLPFPDKSFDVVHSSAVIEHVGSEKNQIMMINEMCRVAKRGVFITTPNRWFPVEFHTLLPLVHWLPNELFRRIIRISRGDFFASEDNLNLMTPRSLCDCCLLAPDFETVIQHHKTLGWPSNILATLRRRPIA